MSQMQRSLNFVTPLRRGIRQTRDFLLFSCFFVFFYVFLSCFVSFASILCQLILILLIFLFRLGSTVSSQRIAWSACWLCWPVWFISAYFACLFCYVWHSVHISTYIYIWYACICLVFCCKWTTLRTARTIHRRLVNGFQENGTCPAQLGTRGFSSSFFLSSFWTFASHWKPTALRFMWSHFSTYLNLSQLK